MIFEDAVYAFLRELDRFDYDLSCADLIWDLIFPDNKGRWYHVRVIKYRHTFYISKENNSIVESMTAKDYFDYFHN